MFYDLQLIERTAPNPPEDFIGTPDRDMMCPTVDGVGLRFTDGVELIDTKHNPDAWIRCEHPVDVTEWL